MMRRVSLLVENGYILTMDPDSRVLERGTVAVDGNRIVAVGDSDELAGAFSADTRVDASDKVIMPGLIDTHGHAGHSMIKTVGHHLTGFGWRTMVDHIYFRSTGEEFWYANGLHSALERLKFGTTCGMYMLGSAPRADRPEPAERFAEGAAAVGVRSVVGIGPARPPWPKTFSWWESGTKKDYQVSIEDTLRVVGEVVDRKQGFGGGLISIWLSASRFLAPSPYDPMFRDDQLAAGREQGALLAQAIKDYDLRLHTHAYGGAVAYTSSELPAELLGPHVCLAHCQGLSDDEVRIMSDTGTSISYCPGARRIYTYPARCPVPEAIDAGATVAIGTDGCAPDRTFDLVSEMRMAMTLQRYALTDPFALPEGKVLRMVTIDAAKALGVDDDLGSLEVGKMADIITVGLNSAHMVPKFMVPYRVVYEASGHDVADVVVDGKLLMCDRQVLSVDEPAVLDMAQREAELAIHRSGVSPLMALPESFWTGSRV